MVTDSTNSTNMKEINIEENVISKKEVDAR